MYIIYKGSVGIYLNTEKIGHCEEGGYFGEIALDKNSVRTADVIAETTVIVFVVRDIDYNRVLYNFKNLEKSSTSKILQKIPLFSNLSHNKILNLINSSASPIFTQGEVIYEYGDKSHSLYVVKSGSVEIQIYSDIEKSNKWPVASHMWNIRKVKSRYVFPLKVVKEGDFFGEYELINKKDRETRAVALNNCLCLAISQSEFEKFIGFNDVLNIQKLNADYNEKTENIKKKFRDILTTSKESHNILFKAMNHETKKIKIWKENFIARKGILNENLKKMNIVSVTKNKIKDVRRSTKFQTNIDPNLNLFDIDEKNVESPSSKPLKSLKSFGDKLLTKSSHTLSCRSRIN